MQKRLFFVVALLLTLSLSALAQVTTSGISGKVTDSTEEIIGATVTAKHVPSGAVYRAVTNISGRYTITGMRAGGPYEVEVSYIGYQSKKFTNIQLSLGQTSILDANLSESAAELKEIVVTADARNGMRSDRSGAVTNLNVEEIASIPTISRQMTDIMRLTPQSSSASGLAIGGGNYRQNNVTIDGASFNNTFGMGSSPLPGGGTPISLEAIEQMTVSITPYDVRQSGFTGGGINAVTKSGTNDFKGTAYALITSNSLKGNRVGDSHWAVDEGHNNTYGLSLGGPIMKDKLFFFANFEYDDIKTAAPTAAAGEGLTPYTNTARRPQLYQLESLSSYMQNTYGLTTGPWQGFSVDNPSYRFLARIDWNITDDHKFNIRFTKSNRKSSNPASASRSIGGSNRSSLIYNGAQGTYGSGSYYGMSSLSSRYYAEYNFTSLAAELNSKFGKLNNTLRGTYSFQDQPRSNEYGEDVPVVEILMNDGQGHYPTWAMMGDIFTRGNLVQTKSLVLTDEANITLGIHNIFAGLQFEHTYAANRYMQAAAGYYAYEATPQQVEAGDWASVFAARPRFFAIAYGNNPGHDMFLQEMSMNQWSLYFQDNISLSDRFRLSAGLRFELPSYPALDDNYNEQFYNLDFGGNHYRTDQVPDNSISVSPRVGFNWDITGDRKYVLRGGTGLFVGRMPYVWLVSARGNSGVGQSTYVVLPSDQTSVTPTFTMSQNDMLTQINAGTSTTLENSTIISSDLHMPKTWKGSLAFDAKLPGGVDFTLEGIYNKDLNPVVVSNKNVYWDGTSTIDLGNGDVRHLQKTYNSKAAYVIENAGSKAYYMSLSAQLRKQFQFGENRLNLQGSYTYSKAKAYSEGIGDQVNSAYNNYRASVHGNNDLETGYATYVAPNRVLLSASFKLKEGKYTSSTFSLVYDGYEFGYLGGYSYSRYSYLFSSAVTGDATGTANLIRIPSSRAELDNWNFVDNGKVDGQTYTADMQRDDFWTFIQQDDYLKNHTGEYAERGGAKMPWHHQLDFKYVRDISVKVGNTRHALQLGLDIMNLPNLLNRNWGAYKQINTNSLLSYNTKTGAYTYNLVNSARNLSTTSMYTGSAAAYQIMFSLRYNFN